MPWREAGPKDLGPLLDREWLVTNGQGPVRLKLQPSVHFRGHDDPVGGLRRAPYVVTAVEDRYELAAGDHLPTLRLWIDGPEAAFTLRGETFPDILYRVEESRGYEHTGSR